MLDGGNDRRGPVEYRDAEPDDLFLTSHDTANFLRADPNTLANLRARGEGLPYYKPNGRPLYKLADVMAAINASGRGYSRIRLENALATFPGLTSKQRADLAAHIQAELWDRT